MKRETRETRKAITLAKEQGALILVLLKAKDDALKLNLFQTVRAIDEATKVVGYEIADALRLTRKRRNCGNTE